MNPTNIKLAIGLILFATWVAFVVFKIPDSADLITAIKLALAGLGAYHLNDRTNAPATDLPAGVSQTTITTTQAKP